MEDLRKYVSLYRDELLGSVIPFWEKNSIDKEYGGYFTCLDRTGKIFDTDKFMWLQGREAYIFSLLYNRVEKKQAWLDIALQGAEFMKKYGRDAAGNWYFSLTREGKPIVQPYNIFSDCFAAMAFGELYKATGDPEHKQIAVDTYFNIIRKQDHPKGIYNKLYPGTRSLKSFTLPMILSNLSLILEDVLEEGTVEKSLKPLVDEILNVFYQKDSGLILENVLSDGSFCDCFEGRQVNPGHTIEATWFLMDIGIRLNDKVLIQKASEIMLNALNYGWDEKYGGIFYFKDIKGYPPQQLEWDQKLWWVHVETLIALAKGYRLTGQETFKQWFLTIHDYTWNHFKDREYPEWYGYLNRQGEPLLTLKGGKWKGCFHVPRGLYQVWKTLDVNE
ncbi:MAG: AGE family epimerase/isomerase [Dysgonamonadaceae bacterium]|jgi:N-acylglucosamine 2-epimerase|nr:AGE family epimerase/isomerase [Dysgonamonadaceae bacterium]